MCIFILDLVPIMACTHLTLSSSDSECFRLADEQAKACDLG